MLLSRLAFLHEKYAISVASKRRGIEVLSELWSPGVSRKRCKRRIKVWTSYADNEGANSSPGTFQRLSQSFCCKHPALLIVSSRGVFLEVSKSISDCSDIVSSRNHAPVQFLLVILSCHVRLCSTHSEGKLPRACSHKSLEVQTRKTNIKDSKHELRQRPCLKISSSKTSALQEYHEYDTGKFLLNHRLENSTISIEI